MDAMMMNQWGLTNAISTMGMMPTRTQLKLVAERCSKLIYLYNPDTAGQEALPYVKDFMREQKVQVLTVQYPDKDKYGKDPCEWGKDLTMNVLDSAKTAKKKIVRL
jgi:DNA primase